MVVDNALFLIANAPTFLYVAGDVPQGIRASQMCVWKYDYSNRSLERVAILMVKRGFSGDKYFGENAGCCVFDRASEQFILVIPTWGSTELGGNLLVEQRMVKTSANILHGSHVLETVSMGLTSLSNWDPELIFKDGLWRHAYSISTTAAPSSPFSPRLRTSPDLVTWTNVTIDPAIAGDVEGMKVAWIGGNPYFTATTTAAPVVYFFDPITFEVVATRAFAELDNSGPPSHGQIVGTPEGDRTRYLMFGMDKITWRGVVFSWGSLTVYEIHQLAEGWDFEVQRVAP